MTYRCAYSGCNETGLTANELYAHGIEGHGSFFGAGYPADSKEGGQG